MVSEQIAESVLHDKAMFHSEKRERRVGTLHTDRAMLEQVQLDDILEQSKRFVGFHHCPNG